MRALKIADPNRVLLVKAVGEVMVYVGASAMS